MNEQKEWYKSKAVWAGIVTAVLGILGAIGIDLASEQDTITDLLVQIGVAVSGVIALVGRLTANKKIMRVIFLPLFLGLLLTAGCSEVSLSPPYQMQLERSAILVNELSARCEAGDQTACKHGLREAAYTLDLLVDASHGIDTTEPNSTRLR